MNKLRIILQYNLTCLIICLVVLVISFIRCNIKTESKYSDEYSIKGTLISKIIDGDKFSFIIKDKEKIKCTYYLSNEEEKKYYDKLDLGVTLEVNGELNDPINNTIPNNFNYKNYLYFNRIKKTFSVNKISVINKNYNLIYSLKNLIIKRIKSYKCSNYLMMFILGDKSLLDKNQYSVYSNLSVTHIFAISGLHVSILSLVFLKIFSIFKNKKYLIVISILIIYMYLTSFSPSIVRSVVFFSFIYFNKEFNIDLEIHNIFYLSISFILLIEPYFLYNLGFLYSSSISYVLIKYNKIINGNLISKMIKISILSTLVSLPITINSNYEVNILGFINNLIFVPFISYILYPLSLFTFMFKFLDNIYYMIIYVLEFISNYLFVFKVIIPKMSIFSIVIYYVFLYIFLNTYKKKYLIFIIILIFLNKYKYLIDNNSFVYFFDVGQGDSSLIIDKHKLFMIDTGGKNEYVKEEWMRKTKYYYTDSIIKCIKSLGYSSIDTLILSHGDYDHMGEALHLVQNFKVNNIIFNCGDFNDLENELKDYVNNKNTFYCLNKYQNLLFLQTKNFDDENDNSNVILTEIKGYKFLFTGDASTLTEDEILSKYDLPNIDVLKVGHHGSKTSSGKNFINKINPKYSVISVGKNNRYGHPNKEVLEILKNSKIHRTDLDGSIIFEINSSRLNS